MNNANMETAPNGLTRREVLSLKELHTTELLQFCLGVKNFPEMRSVCPVPSLRSDIPIELELANRLIRGGKTCVLDGATFNAKT